MTDEEEVQSYIDRTLVFYNQKLNMCFVTASAQNLDLHIGSYIPCTPDVIAMVLNPPAEGIVPVRECAGVNQDASATLPASAKPMRSSTGTVIVNVEIADGKPLTVWLVSDKTKFVLPAEVSPGTYNVVAHFAGWDGPTTVLYGLSVSSTNNTLTFVCSSQYGTCRLKGE